MRHLRGADVETFLKHCSDLNRMIYGKEYPFWGGVFTRVNKRIPRHHTPGAGDSTLFFKI